MLWSNLARFVCGYPSIFNMVFTLEICEIKCYGWSFRWTFVDLNLWWILVLRQKDENYICIDFKNPHIPTPIPHTLWISPGSLTINKCVRRESNPDQRLGKPLSYRETTVAYCTKSQLRHIRRLCGGQRAWWRVSSKSRRHIATGMWIEWRACQSVCIRWEGEFSYGLKTYLDIRP